MHKKYCLTNKSNVVTYSSQIRPVLDLSSKSFSKVSLPRQLRRGTSICPAVLKSLSTGADEGRVVLYLMKAFRTFIDTDTRYLLKMYLDTRYKILFMYLRYVSRYLYLRHSPALSIV